jgi:hypothetical protein
MSAIVPYMQLCCVKKKHMHKVVGLHDIVGSVRP